MRVSEIWSLEGGVADCEFDSPRTGYSSRCVLKCDGLVILHQSSFLYSVLHIF